MGECTSISYSWGCKFHPREATRISNRGRKRNRKSRFQPTKCSPDLIWSLSLSLSLHVRSEIDITVRIADVHVRWRGCLWICVSRFSVCWITKILRLFNQVSANRNLYNSWLSCISDSLFDAISPVFQYCYMFNPW